MSYTKCRDFAGHETNWEGLWYHPEFHNYTSATLNLKALKDFKGTCRIRMFKNRRRSQGDTQPTYLFTISATDLDPDEIDETEVREVERKEYTYSEVRDLLRKCINGCFDSWEYGIRDPYDVIPEDFL